MERYVYKNGRPEAAAEVLVIPFMMFLHKVGTHLVDNVYNLIYLMSPHPYSKAKKFLTSVVVPPAPAHREMDFSQKSFKLVWRYHQLLPIEKWTSAKKALS